MVLDAQDDLSAERAREAPDVDRVDGMAEMEESGGCGGKTGAPAGRNCAERGIQRAHFPLRNRSGLGSPFTPISSAPVLSYETVSAFVSASK